MGGLDVQLFWWTAAETSCQCTSSAQLHGLAPAHELLGPGHAHEFLRLVQHQASGGERWMYVVTQSAVALGRGNSGAQRLAHGSAREPLRSSREAAPAFMPIHLRVRHNARQDACHPETLYTTTSHGLSQGEHSHFGSPSAGSLRRPSSGAASILFRTEADSGN